MKHLQNRRSRKYLCQVKHPVVTENTVASSSLLLQPESTCQSCINYWLEYRAYQQAWIGKKKSGILAQLFAGGALRK